MLSAAAFLLAPSPGRAVNECGALNAGNSFTETCTDQAYTSGITYAGAAGGATLTVGGGTATAITSPTTGASWNNGITVNIPNSTSRRDVSLTVGSAGAVAIVQGSSPQANAWYRNNGIQVFLRAGGGSTTTVDVRSGVTIGTSTTRMANSGISLGLDNAAVTGAGAMSLTSGATIYAATHGINFGNSGPGATTVTNTGAIDASNQGIHVTDTGSAGAVTVTNRGAITAAWQGIYAQTRGTGKDAEGANAGVSVTHTAGAITSSGNRGIHALVGASRQEGNTGHASYVEPMNTGTAKVSVTGGSIRASSQAIEAINFEAGGIDVDVSSGVTLTSSTASGIYAGLHDVGNPAGAIDVDNAGEITAAVTGIWVRQSGAANTGAITVDNEGALKKTGAAEGYGILVEQSGNGPVTITNRGAIGEAAPAAQHRHGIRLVNAGSGASTVTNSGAIHASQRGISVEDSGSAGAVTVTSSGAITAAWQGIRATTTGKDAEGANAGVSVTHSGGAITSSGDMGIQARVGATRAERDTAHADYVAPRNTGLVRVSVTGGSIRSKWRTIEAINFEAGSVEVEVSSGVTLTVTDEDHGIWAQVADAGNADGAVTVTNAGTISAPAAGKYGIFALRESGPGAVSVTNSGAITAGGVGIHALSGAVSVANSANVTSEQSGIYASTAGNDAAGANVGVSVTHSGGTIASAEGRGIRAHVGRSRQEIDAAHADYVAPRNTGLVRVSVTGGSIRSKQQAIEALNHEAGSIDVRVSSGVTLTSTDRSGIHAQLTDVGNERGTITIDSAGTIDAAVNGIFSRIEAGSGTMTVTNRGAVAAKANALFVLGMARHTGDISVTNSGALGTAEAKVSRGLFVAHDGAGKAGDVTVTNRGAIKAADYGIFAKTQGADAGDVSVTNSANVNAGSDGIFAQKTSNDAVGADAGASVTHSGGAIVSANGRGIRAHVGRSRQEIDPDHDDYVEPVNTGLAKVEVTGGSVRSPWPAIEALNHEAGSVEVRISEGATLTSTANSAIHAQVTDVGNESGTITIDSAGTLEAAVSGIFARIVAGSGAMTVTNRGAIAADANAIFLVSGRGGGGGYTGDMTVANSGALGSTATADARVFRGIFVAHDGEGDGGAVTVANRGAIAATDYGILASKANGRGGGVTVTHSGGAIDVESATDAPVLDSQKHGIVARVGAWNQETDPGHPGYVAPRGAGLVKVSVTGGSISSRGTAVEGANYEGGGVEIAIASGVTVSSAREHGIEADLRDVGNTSGTIRITQGGAIRAGGDGISARVARHGPAMLDRPVIDVTWTGTYAAPEQPAPDESIVFVSQAPRVVQAAQAVEAVDELRGGSAGIDAGVMKWQTFMDAVAEGDDPGAFADAAAQAGLFDDAADDATKARAAAIVAQLRSTLTAGTAGPIRDAGDVDADGDDAYSDAEIVAWLSTDSDARRTLLRNVLAKTLTEQEMAVFQAVIEGGDVAAALDAVTGATDEWKTRVRTLSESRNDGDVRIAMNGGSIVSRGDGIRATYAAHRDGNGRIEVTVAEGASVTGAMAGIYVAGAGLDEEDILGQRVTVHGTVTGGTDAAVHLAGGGRATVGRTGQVLAGSSGRAILVNDPGEAIIVIDGTVRGSAPRQGAQPATAPAAVHLTGGGKVTVGQNGRVEANGAASAIQGEGEETTEVTIDGTVQGAEGGRAAVHLAGGGKVTIGLDGRVEANGAELAIRGDSQPTQVLLHVPGDRLTQENAREALARVSGGIGGDSIVGAKDGGANRHTLVLVETDDGRTTGHYTDLPIRADGMTVVDELPILEFDCAMAEDRRCRLYEALPSMLLEMNGLPSYAERTQAARDANGGWAHVEAARGKWRAEKATRPDPTTGKLAYDHQRSVGRAGVDFLAGEQGRVGLSAHALRGKAEMAGVGEAELDGYGAGVSATWLPDLSHGALYVDAQAGVTRYDTDLESAVSGTLAKDAEGTGYAVGLAAGLRMEVIEGVMVTPRAGVVWSKVDLKDFTDLVGVGAHVSVKDAQSTKGRVGVMAETVTGPEESPGRVFASVDVEHEFSDETEVVVTRRQLKTKVRRTGVRLGLGGVFPLSETLSLRALAHYKTSGGDTNEYGGGVELVLKF